MPITGFAQDGDFERTPGIGHAILFFAAVALVVRNLLLDVATRRERLVTGAGDDEAADRFVGFEHLDRTEQLVSKLAIYGVEGVRPVERDDADTVLPLDEDVLKCHAWILLLIVVVLPSGAQSAAAQPSR